MAGKKTPVIGGVDTHGQTHHAAALDQTGRVLGDKEYPATAVGYRALLAWLRKHGTVVKVGVEGTGTYGAGLARYLASEGIALVEVDRPDRKTRRAKGKSDPIDAIAAAQAALSGRADGTPKTRTGPVEAIRALRVARRGAVKARTAALNQLHCIVVSAPQELRDELDAQPGTAALVAYCADLVVDDERIADPAQATMAALRAIAQRVQHFDAEVAQADKRIRPLVTKTAPTLTALMGVGPEVAGQLLVTAGRPRRSRLGCQTTRSSATWTDAASYVFLARPGSSRWPRLTAPTISTARRLRSSVRRQSMNLPRLPLTFGPSTTARAARVS
jgi:transposase